MASTTSWLIQALSDWSAQNAENSYSSLPQLITQYYNSHGTDTSTPEGQSALNAATRGARYAQEGRINAIRSQRGESAFDPMAAPPAPVTSQDPNYTAPPTAYTPPINQGIPPASLINRDPSGNSYRPGMSVLDNTVSAPSGYEASPAAPGYSFGPGVLPPANAAAFGADAQALQSQMGNLKNYLTTRYTGAAKGAGTLGNTAESKAAVDADVNAGMPGAQLALQGQLDTAQQGAQGNVQPTTAPASTPAPAPAADQTASMPNTSEPKVASTEATGLVSGGAPQKQAMNSANRLKALQQKGTNGR